MNLHLQHSALKSQQALIVITGSKSETNRLLLLQALYPTVVLENSSVSDDSQVMVHALKTNKFSTTSTQTINIQHAGTAMRFLTAYFAFQQNREVILTGTTRMKERPIQILVAALQQLGADISYEEQEGFPPLRIKGTKITQNQVVLSATVSSQYISALLLIAPKLENGLELKLVGEITSVPYVKMTLALLNAVGVVTSFERDQISVSPLHSSSLKHYTIESDWSSASYWYSIVALSEIGTQITLSRFKKNSLQGDSVVVEIYKELGVETSFHNDHSITISKVNHTLQKGVEFHLQSAPDIAQTIVVTCFGLHIGCCLKGLQTLKIKETDRLVALQSELTKLGAHISVTQDSLTLQAAVPNFQIAKNKRITTYQDHRMAMAFAPLALKTALIIEEAEVVSKSYPAFWDDLKHVGFDVVKEC